MFKFLTNPSPITLTVYSDTQYSAAFSFSPVYESRSKFPSWWKNIPSSSFSWEALRGVVTSKSCPGISRYLQTGFIVPLWCDLAIKTQGNEWEYQFSDMMSTLEVHPVGIQSPGFYEGYFAFKLNSPWIVETPVQLLCTTPFYQLPDPQPYTIPNGILEPLEGLTKINIFLFIKKTPDAQNIFIHRGTPLLHIIPLTEKTTKLSVKNINAEEYERKARKLGTSTTFTAKGLRNLHVQKKL